MCRERSERQDFCPVWSRLSLKICSQYCCFLFFVSLFLFMLSCLNRGDCVIGFGLVWVLFENPPLVPLHTSIWTSLMVHCISKRLKFSATWAGAYLTSHFSVCIVHFSTLIIVVLAFSCFFFFTATCILYSRCRSMCYESVATLFVMKQNIRVKTDQTYYCCRPCR